MQGFSWRAFTISATRVKSWVREARPSRGNWKFWKLDALKCKLLWMFIKMTFVWFCNIGFQLQELSLFFWDCILHIIKWWKAKEKSKGRPSNSPIKSVFDSSRLSGSIIVQDGITTSFPKTNHGLRSKILLLCRLASSLKGNPSTLS